LGGVSCLFSTGGMLLLREYCRVGRPKVGEAMSVAISLWNGFPQLLTCFFAPMADRVRDHLPCLTAEGNPNPGVVGFFEAKRPQYVRLQRRRSGRIWGRAAQGRTPSR